MDGAQLFAVIASSSVAGIIVKELFVFITGAVKGSVAERRREVDKATALARVETARADGEAANRRVLQEALVQHRILMLESGCFKPGEMPEVVLPYTSG